MVAECSGTALCSMTFRMELRPRRSSSQPGWGVSRPRVAIGCSDATSNHHFVAANPDCVLVEGLGGRARNDLSIDVVETIVAGTPDLMRLLLILHRAVQVSTDGGQRFPFGLTQANQQHGLIAEPDDCSGIRLQHLNLAGDDFVNSRLGYIRGHYEFDGGI